MPSALCPELGALRSLTLTPQSRRLIYCRGCRIACIPYSRKEFSIHGKSCLLVEARTPDRNQDRSQPRQQEPSSVAACASCARPSPPATRRPSPPATRETVSVLDKSVQKGVLHKNTASRYKARLNARVKAVVPPRRPPKLSLRNTKAGIRPGLRGFGPPILPQWRIVPCSPTTQPECGVGKASERGNDKLSTCFVRALPASVV